MTDLSIILVTFNSEDVLEGFLSSLRLHPPQRPWELIVTDNASTDNSVAIIKRGFPESTVIVHQCNLGFAAGVNTAAARANGRFLLLVNPDVAWTGCAIDDLIGFLEGHPRAAAVTPRLIHPDGRPQAGARRFPTHANIWFSRGTPWGRRISGPGGRWAYTVPDPPTAAQAEAVAAAFLLLRANAFIEIGMMDDGFFLYVEDTDLCRRLHNDGREIWVFPDVTVVHGWRGGSARDPVLQQYHREGIRRYFKKHHPEKRVRNALLFGALRLAALLDRRPRAEGTCVW